MTIYDELKIVASELLREFNQSVISLIKVTPGTGPTDNPGNSSTTSYMLDAVAKGVSFKYIRQGFAVISDLEITAAVVDGVTPSEKDFIEIDSIKYKIIQMMNVPAAGTKIVWKFIVRKGV